MWETDPYSEESLYELSQSQSQSQGTSSDQVLNKHLFISMYMKHYEENISLRKFYPKKGFRSKKIWGLKNNFGLKIFESEKNL